MNANARTSTVEPLDRLRRPLRALRLSLTDQCNLRCGYCMPEDDYNWLSKEKLLNINEISILASSFYHLGVRKLRLTGGEPLLRPDIVEIVTTLNNALPSLELTMTTNATMLERLAQPLHDAGLRRVTVSLDAVDARAYQTLTKRNVLSRALRGLQAAARLDFEEIKLNAVVMANNLNQLGLLLEAAKAYGAELRLIEYMDVGGATRWTEHAFVSADVIRSKLQEIVGPLTPIPRVRGATANRYALPSGQTVGIIESMSSPFCSDCDRSRVTADGMWYHCLYAQDGIDLRPYLGQSPHALTTYIAEHWRQRRAQGALERYQTGTRGSLYTLAELRQSPHLEMHTRGG